MVKGLLFHSTSVKSFSSQSALRHKSAFSSSHFWWQELLYKEPTCSSGTVTHTHTHKWSIGSSVSCPRTCRTTDWADDLLYLLNHSCPQDELCAVTRVIKVTTVLRPFKGFMCCSTTFGENSNKCTRPIHIWCSMCRWHLKCSCKCAVHSRVMIGMSTETFKGFKWTIFCEDSFF